MEIIIIIITITIIIITKAALVNTMKENNREPGTNIENLANKQTKFAWYLLSE